MRFTDALLNPNGRLSRGGFWVGGLTLAVVSALAALSLMSLSDLLASRASAPYSTTFGDAALRPTLIALVLIVPVTWMAFCLSVKRWHDRGRSGWWVIISLVPVVGQLWALVECGFLKGAVSGNKYGPAPLKGEAISHWPGDEIPEDMA